MKKESIYDAGKKLVEDTEITTKLKATYLKEDFLKGMEIHVTTKEGVVTLTGTVSSDKAIDKAIKIAKDIEGVKDVTSELEIDEE